MSDYIFNNEDSKILSKTFSIFGELLINIPTKNFFETFQNNNLFLSWYIEPVKNINTIKQLTAASTNELKSENIYQKIKEDYTSMFIYGDMEIKAIPWGSVYLNKNNETFANETFIVKEFFDKYNFEIPSNFKEPPDHIGIQLVFVGYLLSNWSTLNNEQKITYQNDIKDLLANYLLPWFPSFFKKMSESAKTTFYKLISYLLDDFLYQIKNLLKIEISSCPIYY